VAGLKVHEAPAGNPGHVKVTLPAYLAAPVTLSGTLALCPEVTVTVELALPPCTAKGEELGIATRETAPNYRQKVRRQGPGKYFQQVGWVPGKRR
jgi:hypothetical protein